MEKKPNGGKYWKWREDLVSKAGVCWYHANITGCSEKVIATTNPRGERVEVKTAVTCFTMLAEHVFGSFSGFRGGFIRSECDGVNSFLDREIPAIVPVSEGGPVEETDPWAY